MQLNSQFSVVHGKLVYKRGVQIPVNHWGLKLLVTFLYS